MDSGTPCRSCPWVWTFRINYIDHPWDADSWLKQAVAFPEVMLGPTQIVEHIMMEYFKINYIILSFFLFFISFLTLQYCIGFAIYQNESTTGIHVFPILNPPPSPYPPSGSSQCTRPELPVSCIEPGLATRFIYDIIHVSMPFSQIIPPSPSPGVQKTVIYISVSFLSRVQGYCYHLSKFHIYALVYCIGVFLFGLLHSV